MMNIEDIKVIDSPTLMVEVDNEKSAPVPESAKSPVFIRYIKNINDSSFRHFIIWLTNYNY